MSDSTVEKFSVLRLGHSIRASFDDNTIRVYQAYGDAIADEVVETGRFGNSFMLDRMTWIKPSFLWMMYRSGWGEKPGQNRILAIDINREGFREIVSRAVLSSYNKDLYDSRDNWKKALKESGVRCQWDPERDIYGNPQDRRTIQLGIKGKYVKWYTSDWIVQISDITPLVVEWRKKKQARTLTEAMLPQEIEYLT